jgi:NADH-ubiquinone oxidoreductase chain 4L
VISSSHRPPPDNTQHSQAFTNYFVEIGILLRWFFIFLFIFICVVLIIVYFLLFFGFFFVCEGSLVLSILVSIIRSHGNDYFQSYSVLQC